VASSFLQGPRNFQQKRCLASQKAPSPNLGIWDKVLYETASMVQKVSPETLESWLLRHIKLNIKFGPISDATRNPEANCQMKSRGLARCALSLVQRAVGPHCHDWPKIGQMPPAPLDGLGPRGYTTCLDPHRRAGAVKTQNFPPPGPEDVNTAFWVPLSASRLMAPIRPTVGVSGRIPVCCSVFPGADCGLGHLRSTTSGMAAHCRTTSSTAMLDIDAGSSIPSIPFVLFLFLRSTSPETQSSGHLGGPRDDIHVKQ
jgi:hypothetical protein